VSAGAQQSPKISAIEWGETVVDGVGHLKDAKIWPGGGREWDWSETGTRHVPGIQPSDVQELLNAGVDVVVLTRGMELRLHTCAETLELLEARGVEVHVDETNAAVEIYNELAGTRRVGALIHSTC
jgi:hypothetical protein